MFIAILLQRNTKAPLKIILQHCNNIRMLFDILINVYHDKSFGVLFCKAFPSIVQQLLIYCEKLLSTEVIGNHMASLAILDNVRNLPFWDARRSSGMGIASILLEL